MQTATDPHPLLQLVISVFAAIKKCKSRAVVGGPDEWLVSRVQGGARVYINIGVGIGTAE